VRKLIKEFDQDVKFGIPALRPLRFVRAGDIFGALVQAIADPGQKEEGGTTGGSTRPSTSSNRGTGIGGGDLFGGNRSGGGLGGLGSDSGGFGRSSGGGMSLSESLSTGDQDVTPEARIIGNTRIIADKRANTIIVIGNNEVKNKVFGLLDKLDVRAPQVAIHTIIGELNLTNNESFGINYIVNNGGRVTAGSTGTGTGTGNGNGGTGGGTGTDGTGTGAIANNVISLNNGVPGLNLNNLLGNRTITQIVTGGASGLSGFVTAGNAFNAIVDALESTNRFRVVSRPSVFTSNSKRALIASGEEIAVPRSINSGFAGGNVNVGSNLVTQSSIDYKTVALQLEVLPLINSEREVTLEIVQKVDEVSGSDLIDNNPVPRIATRVLQTTVSVPNEGTLALGGLIRARNSKTTSGIPYLSRIPVLGPLFRRTTTDKSRTELVILMRPVVSLNPCEDIDTKERGMEFFNIEPDLESTIYPSNLRKKVPAVEMSRRSPLTLRQETECVEEGFGK
jgi:general secretion pathway protein D